VEICRREYSLERWQSILPRKLVRQPVPSIHRLQKNLSPRRKFNDPDFCSSAAATGSRSRSGNAPRPKPVAVGCGPRAFPSRSTTSTSNRSDPPPMLCNPAQLGAGEQGDEARVQSALAFKIGKDGGKQGLQVVRLAFREIDRSKPVRDGPGRFSAKLAVAT
jgi:hypothetical protein